MSGTLVRSAVAGAVCALALGGCDARSDGDGAAPGDADASGEAAAAGGGMTFSGGGDRVTFGSGGDAVSFSASPENAVTFSSGGDVTFSSGGGASFSSGVPAPSAPAAPAATGAGDPASTTSPAVPATTGVGDAGDPAAVDPIGSPDLVDPADPADLPTATAPPAASGPSGTATRGADPRFDFWDGDEVGAALTSDDFLFRIALYGDEIWLEWFADEGREGGSGENCWSPYLTTARLDREGELFVRNMGDDGATRVEYTYDAGAGTLIEEMYLQDELQYSERYRPVLAGTSFADFPVCDET